MPHPSGHESSLSVSLSGDLSGWLNDTFRVAYETFDDPQTAGAAALISAATRIVLTGSGPSLDAAAFGTAVFSELGFDTATISAADLRYGEARYQPGDLVVGIDSDSSAVAGALRRARNAGLHTIGVTTRDLTIIDADVLLYVPTLSGQQRPGISSTLSCCLGLALLAARVEPGTAVAIDTARIERFSQAITSETGRLMASILFSSSADKRVIFAGRGAARWVSRAVAGHLNQLPARHAGPLAIAADLDDVDEGFWAFRPADILVRIDPYDRKPLRQFLAARATTSISPHRTWSLSRQRGPNSESIHIPATSPAIASLIAFVALSASLETAGQSALTST